MTAPREVFVSFDAHGNPVGASIEAYGFMDRHPGFSEVRYVLPTTLPVSAAERAAVERGLAMLEDDGHFPEPELRTLLARMVVVP